MTLMKILQIANTHAHIQFLSLSHTVSTKYIALTVKLKSWVSWGLRACTAGASRTWIFMRTDVWSTAVCHQACMRIRGHGRISFWSACQVLDNHCKWREQTLECIPASCLCCAESIGHCNESVKLQNEWRTRNLGYIPVHFLPVTENSSLHQDNLTPENAWAGKLQKYVSTATMQCLQHSCLSGPSLIWSFHFTHHVISTCFPVSDLDPILQAPIHLPLRLWLTLNTLLPGTAGLRL